NILMRVRSETRSVSNKLLACIFLWSAILCAQQPDHRPDWCKKLPRPVYASLERVLPNESWFEVYRVRPGVFAIYEPHQFEEVISYLIVGSQHALLLDTGMGIASMQKLVAQLTSLPLIVLNTHTHYDHIGSNYEFKNVWAVNTEFTKANSKGYPASA